MRLPRELRKRYPALTFHEKRFWIGRIGKVLALIQKGAFAMTREGVWHLSIRSIKMTVAALAVPATGCGGLNSRHDAMLAGEQGADYVMFGEPDEHEHRPSFGAVLERVAWWAEVFEIPCVGFAASLAEASEFAAVGADFVLVGDFVWADPRGAAAALGDAEAAIRQAYAAPRAATAGQE